MKEDDLIGQKFGLLTVESVFIDRSYKMCKCLCDCGDTVVTRLSSLKSGHTKGCGQKHRRIEDLTGKTFGKLTVISRGDDYYYKNGARLIRWWCQCECGKMTLVRGTALRAGNTVSCGCTRSASSMGTGLVDLTGRVFGRWSVLYENGRKREPRGKIVPIWRCRCICGAERDIRAGTLVSGNSLSCGCYKIDRLKEKASVGFGLSKLELQVKTILDEIGVKYQQQVVFDDLKSVAGYPLSIDFLVECENGLSFFIECQGRQHYEPIEYFGGEE